jgi:hypothetical protein
VHPAEPRPRPHLALARLIRRGTDISAPYFSLPVPNAVIFVQQNRRNVRGQHALLQAQKECHRALGI